MKYLLEFIIGSNPIIFIPFFIFVYNKIKQDKLEISYFLYSLSMPIIYGFWNVLGKYLQDLFKYSNNMRFFVISQISFFSLMILLLNTDVYNYHTFERWSQHFIGVYIFYLFTFFVTINVIEKIILNKKFTNNELNVVYLVSIICILRQVFALI